MKTMKDYGVVEYEGEERLYPFQNSIKDLSKLILEELNVLVQFYYNGRNITLSCTHYDFPRLEARDDGHIYEEYQPSKFRCKKCRGFVNTNLKCEHNNKCKKEKFLREKSISLSFNKSELQVNSFCSSPISFTDQFLESNKGKSKKENEMSICSVNIKENSQMEDDNEDSEKFKTPFQLLKNESIIMGETTDQTNVVANETELNNSSQITKIIDSQDQIKSNIKIN